MRWNGGSRTTTFVSASQLTAAIPAADIAVAGTAQVTVANPDGGLSNALPFTTTSPSTSCPCSIWPSTATPAVASNNDPNSLEVGVRFQSDSAGYIKGIRFYKGSSNTGPHTGKLWTASGTLMASATFSGETASGWQEVRFATPVAIAASTTYVASYYTASGFYSVTRPLFHLAGLQSAAPCAGGRGRRWQRGLPVRGGRRVPHLDVQLGELLGRRGLRLQRGLGVGPDADRPGAQLGAGRGAGVHLDGDGHELREWRERAVEWREPADDVREREPGDGGDSGGRHRRAGTAQVTVVNPDTSVSNALPFTTNAGPTLTALAPSSHGRGAGVHLDGDGHELREWREVRWNGGTGRRRS